MLCAIWYNFYNLKNVKNTHGRVQVLVKLQTETCNVTKSSTAPWAFSNFSNCKHGAKPRKASRINSVIRWRNLLSLNRIIVEK